MTVKQAARVLRSLYFRQRLAEDIPALESEVMEFVEETGMQFLAGFKVEVRGSRVRLSKVEVNSEQLHFNFGEEDS